jgi:hypothetical protein
MSTGITGTPQEHTQEENVQKEKFLLLLMQRIRIIPGT